MRNCSWRRRVLLCSLIGSLVWAASSSVSRASSIEYRLGVQQGIEVSNLAYDPDIPTDWYKAGALGISNEFRESGSLFSVNFEINHVQRGSSFFELNVDKIDRYRYLEFVLLARMSLYQCKTFCIYVEAGPAASVLLQATQTAGLGASATTADIRSAKKSEYGIQGGAGIEAWYDSNFALYLSGRYVHGLTYASDSTATYSRAKIRAFEFFFGPKIKF